MNTFGNQEYMNWKNISDVKFEKIPYGNMERADALIFSNKNVQSILEIAKRNGIVLFKDNILGREVILIPEKQGNIGHHDRFGRELRENIIWVYDPIFSKSLMDLEYYKKRRLQMNS